MATPEIREFSLAYEVDKLRKMLMLPITNIVFDERYEYGKQYLDDNMDYITIYAKLYVNDDLIGTIPYMSDRFGPMYDTSKQDELAWDIIYRQFKQIIFDKIFQQQALSASVEVKEYLSLDVKDKNGILINKAYCNYLDEEWNVAVGGLNPVKKIKVTKVILEVPPSIKGNEIS